MAPSCKEALPISYLELELAGLEFILDFSSADAFTQNVASSPGVAGVGFDLLLRWSKRQGLSFRGRAALEVRVPTHISVGPIEILDLTIAARFKDKKLPVELGATIKASLGPLVAVVENMGARIVISFPNDGRGNLGPIGLDLGFKPPNGVGLAIDAGAVKGGGYLYFDFEKEEYAGVLELSIANFLTLTAVGLVTTRMPDGSKGFSLLIIITAEFGGSGPRRGCTSRAGRDSTAPCFGDG